MGASAEELRRRLRERLRPLDDPRAQLRDRLAQPEQEGGATDAFLAEGARTFLNNFLGMGEAVSTAGGRAKEPMMNVPGMDRASQGFMRMPQAHELEAAARAAPALAPGGEAPGEAFQRERQGVEERIEGTREEHPIATMAGDISGDIATLVTGRAPVARLVQRAESRLAPKPTIFFGNATPGQMSNARFVWEQTLARPGVRKLARGLGRSTETGLEAAVLDTMKGDDPLETAAWAAGGQMGGSVLLETMKGLFSGGPLKAAGKLTVAAVTTGGALQLLKSATPGGRDFILESMESGFDKVKWGLALGAMSGAVGAGRLRDKEVAERFPQIIDAVMTTPRGFALSVLEQWRDGDVETKREIERRLEMLAENPEAVDQGTAQRIMDRPELFQNARIRGQ